MDVTHPRLLDAEGTGSTFPKMSVFTGHHSISSHKTWIFVYTPVRTKLLKLVCNLLGVFPTSDYGMPTIRYTASVPSSKAGYEVRSMVDWKRTRYLYRGRGLLEVVGPMERGRAGSGRFRVSEQVWRGRYKRSVSGLGWVTRSRRPRHLVVVWRLVWLRVDWSPLSSSVCMSTTCPHPCTTSS